MRKRAFIGGAAMAMATSSIVMVTPPWAISQLFMCCASSASSTTPSPSATFRQRMPRSLRKGMSIGKPLLSAFMLRQKE